MNGVPQIRSFVRRSTRKNESQQRAWENLRGKYLIELPRLDDSLTLAGDAKLDLATVFASERPLIVEIGCGNGDSLWEMAAARDANVVAFEVFEPAIANALAKLDKAGLENVRIIMADGAEALPKLIPDSSLTELWSYFADPWHKKRHHKRRLISTDFAELVTRNLVPGGRWLIATDWEDYAEWIAEVLDSAPGLEAIEIEQIDGRPFGRPLTKYERTGLAAGRTIREFAVRKVAA